MPGIFERWVAGVGTEVFERGDMYTDTVSVTIPSAVTQNNASVQSCIGMMMSTVTQKNASVQSCIGMMMSTVTQKNAYVPFIIPRTNEARSGFFGVLV